MYKYIYIMATKVNMNAQAMAHLHGGATTLAQPHCTVSALPGS